jgi:small subunit ribosomal protein S7
MGMLVRCKRCALRRSRKKQLPKQPEGKTLRLETLNGQAKGSRTVDGKQADPIEALRSGSMPRRKRATRRQDLPDAKYKNKNITRFVNKMMIDGKRSLSERIVYDAFDSIEAKQKRSPVDVFEQAIKNATPGIEVKPRRVGGSTYQVPVDVRRDRGNALAMRWLIRSARTRTGRSMAEKLASELMDAAAGQGATIRKREETHKMAESNRAFAHYRW